MYAIERSTGEVLPTQIVTVPTGTILFTPEEQRIHRQQRECMNAKAETRRRTDGKKYFFTWSNRSYEDVKPAYMARLIYLATYMDYTGKLTQHKGKAITRSDLPQVLGLTPGPTSQFWTATKDRYLKAATDGTLEISPEFFLRGTLRRQDTASKQYQQFWIEAVRNLYERTDPRNHQYLGYIFHMLQFVNAEYNILCWNPAETDLDKIRCMTADQFCEAIGYDTTNRARLIKTYTSITFDTENGKERFCSFVGDPTSIDEASIYINPNILYKGHHFDKVEILGKFCIVKDKLPERMRAKIDEQRALATSF